MLARDLARVRVLDDVETDAGGHPRVDHRLVAVIDELVSEPPGGNET
jgi:hypothetical protein